MTFIGRQIIQLQNYPRALCSTEDWSQPEGYISLLTLVPDELRRHVIHVVQKTAGPVVQTPRPPTRKHYMERSCLNFSPHRPTPLCNFGLFLPYLDKLLKCYFVGAPSLLLLLADDGCSVQ